jgi:AcrR family transcriptional regulator
MARAVKSRSYDNSRREAGARQTRRAVLDAARDLWLRNGYAATSLAEIAAAAGVSVQTVYGQFQSKRNLLKNVVDVAIVGDDEPVALADRPEVAAINAEPDPERKLRMHAALGVEIAARMEPLDRMMRSAAQVDADVAEQVATGDRGRYMGMLLSARDYRAAGVLREDLTDEEVAQRMWVLLGPAMYRPYVVDQGWPVEAFEEWLGDLLVASLLPPGSARARRAAGPKSGRKPAGERR